MDFKLKYLIQADGKQARSELEGVDKAIDRLSQRGRSGMADVFGGNVATQAFSRLTGMATDAGTAIFDFSSRMEQSKIAFTTLMGNSAAATKHLEDLKKISMSTPLEFGSLAKMSQRLQGAGIESKKVVDLIKDIGNTAAATGDLTVERMEGIGVAISQVFSKGKVSAEEMEQLAERGIPAWRILSQSLGKTVGETRKLAEEGKITSEVFLSAFEQFTRMNFGDAMEKQAATFSGAMGKITNIATITASEAFKPIFERISRFADDVSQSLSDQQSRVTDAGISFGIALGDAIGSGLRRGLGESEGWLDFLNQFNPQNWAYQIQYGVAAGLRGFDAQGTNASGQAMVFDPATMTMRPAGGGGGMPQNTSPMGLPPVSGGVRKPPRETDREFRRFFEEMGFSVSRTFGGKINEGSLHPSGMAADVRSRGKSVEQIFALTVKALEKGYRLFDERIKRPGVKQTGPHLHFERNGGSKASSFLDPSYYGGPDQLAYLKMLDQQRLGKATGTAGLNDFIQQRTDAEVQHNQELEAAFRAAAEDMIQAEAEASDARLDIRRAEAELALEIIADQVNRGVLTEWEGSQRVARLKVDMLKEELQELERQEPTVENLHKIEILRLAIAKQEAENARLEFEYQQKITEEINKQLGLLQKKNQRPGMSSRQPNDGTEFSRGVFGGIDAATGHIRTMDDVMRQLGQTAGDVFMQMGQGLGQMLESWVLLGDQADISMKKMVASVLAGVASQAATLSIFHIAMGIAALTPWGRVMYGDPILHFKAAAIWGGVAAGAALGGRALAGDSGGQGGSGSASSSGSSSGSRSNLTPDAISRVSENAFTSGRDEHIIRLATVIGTLERKISTMKAGDVLVAGARQQRGFIGKQVAEDIKTNASTGSMILRNAGVR